MKYDDKWYPAKIVKRIDEDEYAVTAMEIKGINKFRWPDKEDRLIVHDCDIITVIKDSLLEGKRFLSLSNNDYSESERIFVTK